MSAPSNDQRLASAIVTPIKKRSSRGGRLREDYHSAYHAGEEVEGGGAARYRAKLVIVQDDCRPVAGLSRSSSFGTLKGPSVF